MSRMSNRMRVGTFGSLFSCVSCLAWGAIAGSAVVACGGSDKPVVSPTATADGGAAAAGTAGGTSTPSTATPDAHADVSDAAKPDYAKGWQAWANGDLAGAAAAFQSAASEDPKSGAPLYALGVVKERQGDVSGAQQQYRAAYTTAPGYEFAIAAYAESLAANGHLSDADSFLTDQHSKYPNATRVTSTLADVKSQEKDSGSAQELAQAALRIDPNFTPAMVVIARDNYRTRRMELARYALHGHPRRLRRRQPGA